MIALRLRKNRRLLAGAGIVLAALLLGLVGPALLRAAPLFRVRRIEVTGIHYLDAAAVARSLGLRPDASIFDPAGPLERNALRVPGLLRATITRRIPGTLKVRVDERTPVALAESDGRLALVDRRGRVLPFDPARGTPDLPIAPADSAVLGVLDRLEDSDPRLFGSIVGARRERGAVILETASHRLLFRIGASTREIQGLALVMAEVERRRMRVAEFDARFEGRVIVRGER